jgi:transposase-like protein
MIGELTMDGSLESRAKELATEFAGSATTIEELNGLVRLMMKSGLERMLDAEMDVHLGRRPGAASGKLAAADVATSARSDLP